MIIAIGAAIMKRAPASEWGGVRGRRYPGSRDDWWLAWWAGGLVGLAAAAAGHGEAGDQQGGSESADGTHSAHPLGGLRGSGTRCCHYRRIRSQTLIRNVALIYPISPYQVTIGNQDGVGGTADHDGLDLPSWDRATPTRGRADRVRSGHRQSAANPQLEHAPRPGRRLGSLDPPAPGRPRGNAAAPRSVATRARLRLPP